MKVNLMSKEVDLEIISKPPIENRQISVDALARKCLQLNIGYTHSRLPDNRMLYKCPVIAVGGREPLILSQEDRRETGKHFLSIRSMLI